jgi:hypothetical protein
VAISCKIVVSHFVIARSASDVAISIIIRVINVNHFSTTNSHVNIFLAYLLSYLIYVTTFCETTGKKNDDFTIS